ncbi:BUD22-domain-containing protein [Aspergillus crustosus]
MAASRSLMRLGNGRSLTAAARSSRNCRAFSSTPLQYVAKATTAGTDIPNMRQADRPPQGPLRAPVINPADKHADKADSLHTYGQYIMSCLPKHVQQFSVWKDELVIYIPPSGVIPVMTFLKYHTAAEFTTISDITAVDYPTRDQRFEVVYNLLSIRYNSRIRVKTYADEASPVPSVTGLHEGALWYEREVYDLFGVFFSGHPDLRRIMTDYGFDGHPLRKDFPMTGYTELRYDEEKKRIVIEPLELTQAFRNFEGGTAAWEPVGSGKDRTPESGFKMPKRKLTDLSSVPPPSETRIHPYSEPSAKPNYRLQTTRLKQKFEFGVTTLARALKAARGSERQKLGRRQKTAKEADNAAETLRRIDGEIKVLKELDPTSTAEKYLFKQLIKTKRVAEAPIFKRFKQAKLIKLEAPKSTEEANVTARLFKSAPVRNVLPGILDGLKGLPGLEGKKKDDEAKTKAKGEGAVDGEETKKSERRRAASMSGDESDDEPRPTRDLKMDLDISASESEENYSQFNARLASDSEDDDDDLSLAKLKPKQQPPRRSMSISLSPEPSLSPSLSLSPEPSPQKKPKSSSTPATSTTFLPSLMMGGYWSGSDSEPEELEEAPKRKNRMGQQARRALWEKKYGVSANHVKEGKTAPSKKGGRDSGWDVRKGATGEGDNDRNRKKWGTGSNAMAMTGKTRDMGQGGGGGGVGRPKKAQDDGKPLHPSWEAARKAKEAKSMASFQGKKVVFD